MTGFEAIAAEAALSEGIAAAKMALAKAEQRTAGTVERACAYLDAAHQATVGLRGEYREILEAASALQVSDPAARDALCHRIDHYLSEDEVRPLLTRAIGGLEQCAEALSQTANHRFSRLRLRAQSRRVAADQLTEQLNHLVAQMQALDQDFVKRPYSHPSGVGLDDLLEIKQQLKRPDVHSTGHSRAEEFRVLVTQMREREDVSVFLEQANNIARVTEELRQAYA